MYSVTFIAGLLNKAKLVLVGDNPLAPKEIPLMRRLAGFPLLTNTIDAFGMSAGQVPYAN